MTTISFDGHDCATDVATHDREGTASRDAFGWNEWAFPSIASQHDRFRRLHRTFDALEEAFVDLGELIDEYVASVDLERGEDHAVDARRFLGWLETSYGLTTEQRRQVERVSH